MIQIENFPIQDPELEQYLRLEPLLKGVFENDSMSEIMEILEKMLSRPVMVIDMGFKIIDESPSINDNYRLYERNDIFLAEHCIDQIKANHIYYNLTKRKYSSKLIELPEHENFMISSIKTNSTDVMMLIIFENGLPFQVQDYSFIKKICEILAVQYQKEGIAYDSHMVLPNHIVFALLNGEYVSREEFTKRVDFFPWTKYEEHYIMLLDDIRDGIDLRPRHAAILKSILAYIEPDHCLTYKNLIIGFLGSEQFKYIYRTHRTEFEEYLTSNGLICSISQAYTDIMDSRKYYSSALNLLQCVRKYKLRLAYFFDSHFYVLHDLITDHYDPSYFYHPVVDKLTHYDRENHTNLLETLEVYLTFKSEPDTAAERLYIHRSTLYYRLKKIREITDCDIESHSEAMQIYFSIQIKKIEDSMYANELPD